MCWHVSELNLFHLPFGVWIISVFRHDPKWLGGGFFLQKKMMFKFSVTHTPHFYQSGLLKLDYVFDYQSLLFTCISDFMLNQLPDSFNSCFPTNRDIHLRTTRQSKLLRIPAYSSKYAQRQPLFSNWNKWNTLFILLRDNTSRYRTKRITTCKYALLQKYPSLVRMLSSLNIWTYLPPPTKLDGCYVFTPVCYLRPKGVFTTYVGLFCLCVCVSLCSPSNVHISAHFVHISTAHFVHIYTAHSGVLPHGTRQIWLKLDQGQGHHFCWSHKMGHN